MRARVRETAISNSNMLLSVQACIDRIKGDESGHKHCTGQYFDYWRCIDKCVSFFSFFFCKRKMNAWGKFFLMCCMYLLLKCRWHPFYLLN